MDKAGKLQRYVSKDYSEIVDFPVEIIGRDGVVRRYNFEDSIRLYQRRVTFAPLRHRDAELVEAEVLHCRARIEQLRRSYFHRFGWGVGAGEADPLAELGELAGEVAGFLGRLLRAPGRPDVRVARVAPAPSAAEPEIWHVTPAGQAAGSLLYVYRFAYPVAQPVGGGHTPDDPAREHFFARLRALERVGRGRDEVERLVAMHHAADCALLLTAQGDTYERFARLEDEAVDDDAPPTAWDLAVEAIRQGQLDEALRRCVELVADQPWHRDAYVAGAVLANALGRALVAEDLSLVGARYFPDDAVLHYHLGLARRRAGRPGESVAPLERALELAPGFSAARLLLVLNHLAMGQYREASDRAIAPTLRLADDDGAADGLRAVRRLLRARGALITFAGALIAAGLTALPVGLLTPSHASAWVIGPGLLAALAGGASIFGIHQAFRWGLARAMARQRLDEVGHALRRVARAGALGQ
jgi:tetratricopeptide (TPR) repeat protein